MPLKIISFNTWYSKFWSKMVPYLQSVNADIICLQEVSRNWPNFGLEKVDVVEKITQALPGYSCVYAPILARVEKGIVQDLGNLTLCKRNIVQKKIHYLFQQPDWKIDDYENQARNMVEVQLDCDGELLSIFNTHLSYSARFVDSPRKILESQKMKKIIEKREHAILCGDLNSPPNSKVIEELRSILPRGDYSSEFTFAKYPFDYNGFHVSSLEYKLDYILATSSVKIENVHVPDISISDHLPIVADVQISTG